MKGCLTGVKVLDMSRIFAGPFVGQNLADLGAEVIKIERPGRGDEARRLGPPFLKDVHGQDTTESAFYLSANRNKRSITIDITSAKGRDLLYALIRRSDVLIENYKAGALKRYGLDYESVAKVNPRLVYCSITGFGQSGPFALRPGYDTLFQATGGLMSVTGNPDGSPGDGPQKVGIVVADIMTGLYGALSVVAALRYRDQISGKGQAIDLALLDCQVAGMSHAAMAYLVSGENPERFGTGAAAVVPSQMFKCKTGYIILVVGNDEQFDRFCKEIGAPELLQDARFAGNKQRVKHREVLVPLIQARLLARSAEDWIAAMERISVPCGPVNTLKDVFANEQIRYRKMATTIKHASGVDIPMVSSPLNFSDSPVASPTSPPTLGQHTAEVLKECLSLTDAEIDGLRAAGVI